MFPNQTFELIQFEMAEHKAASFKFIKRICCCAGYTFRARRKTSKYKSKCWYISQENVEKPFCQMDWIRMHKIRPDNEWKGDGERETWAFLNSQLSILIPFIWPSKIQTPFALIAYFSNAMKIKVLSELRRAKAIFDFTIIFIPFHSISFRSILKQQVCWVLRNCRKWISVECQRPYIYINARSFAF